MIRTLKELTKEYTKQPAGIRLTENLASSLRDQQADILEWISQPWDGSIPIPGWQFDLHSFYKGSDDKENEYDFVVINATGHRYYWPLLRLGCCAPVGLLRKGVAAVNQCHNKTIFRAMVLNSFKLFINAKERHNSGHPKIEVGWTTFMENSGGDIAEEVAYKLRELMADGLITRPEDLAADVDTSESDEMNFPSSQDGFMTTSGVNAPVRDGYHTREMFYKASEGTKAWVNQLIQFVKAKLSYVRSVKSTYVADAPSIGLGEFEYENYMQSLQRITYQLNQWYYKQNDDARSVFRKKYPFIRDIDLTCPERLATLLQKNTLVWGHHCAFVKRHMFKYYYKDFAKVLESTVDLCERCKGNMFVGKSSRRHSGGVGYFTDANKIISGIAKLTPSPEVVSTIASLTGRYMSDKEIAAAANVYELGVEDSEDFLLRCISGDLKDKGIPLPDSVHRPVNALARGMSYLDMVNEFESWYGMPTVDD